jgi:hypothetical protein
VADEPTEGAGKSGSESWLTMQGKVGLKIFVKFFWCREKLADDAGKSGSESWLTSL